MIFMFVFYKWHSNFINVRVIHENVLFHSDFEYFQDILATFSKDSFPNLRLISLIFVILK